ncbi:CBS domain containing-hemolysin-like protein [Branchiibius hedensis]|uniref:Hemolysin, contains CBS domains n=1 Tax=Branchiibius hedensis TaxID=672460 RepID=A0A2Y8ZLQ7_9MICO|nr:hemolysin family protein [Branchiibius hedensis]PWJ24453.1 CBS domain containing-hemolysin-like protein [Branchiibius hedensis]SSA33270.1 Hemolysin, contains CBS domains [Branchiibius hedensis]
MIWLSLLFLAGNAFFVGAEFAVMAARRSQIEPLAAAGSARAKMALEAFENVASMLACAQLGITVCSVLLGAVAEDAIHHWLEAPLHSLGLGDAWASGIALLLALLLVMYLHVVVGEMIPKNLAIAGPDRAALLLAPPLLWITKVLRPVIALVEWIAKFFVRRLGVEPKDEIASTFSAEEVGTIVEESTREGLLQSAEHERFVDALEFSDHVASDVAVPLSQLITVPLGASPADVERLVAEHGFSRYPVVGPDGSLVGYLHLKDVLYATDEAYGEPVPPKRIRNMATVGPSAEVEDVLLTMQRTGLHLARVVSSTGETTGVVFLEDVLEELVGEVADATQS